MHPEVAEYVSRFATTKRIAALDVGGRDVNGSARHVFPNARWYGIDLEPGPGVDEVADAATWRSSKRFDLVLCTEVFEHTGSWPQICVTAFEHLKVGGRFVVTCAGPMRYPHSAVDGLGLRPGEYYKNLDVNGLRGGLEGAGFTDVQVEQRVRDVRGTGIRGAED